MLETERRENKEGKNDVGFVGQKRQKRKKKKDIGVPASISLYFSCSVTWSRGAINSAYSLGESPFLFTCRNKGMMA